MSEKATIRKIPGVTGWGAVDTTRPEHPLGVSKRGGSRGGRPRSPQRCHRPRQRLPSRPRPPSRCCARGRDQGCARAASGPGFSALQRREPSAGQRPAASGRACRAGQAPDLTFLSGLARPLAVPDAATVGLPARPGSAHAPPRKARPFATSGCVTPAAPPPRARPKQLLLGSPAAVAATAGKCVSVCSGGRPSRPRPGGLASLATLVASSPLAAERTAESRRSAVPPRPASCLCTTCLLCPSERRRGRPPAPRGWPPGKRREPTLTPRLLPGNAGHGPLGDGGAPEEGPGARDADGAASEEDRELRWHPYPRLIGR